MLIYSYIENALKIKKTPYKGVSFFVGTGGKFCRWQSALPRCLQASLQTPSVKHTHPICNHVCKCRFFPLPNSSKSKKDGLFPSFLILVELARYELYLCPKP